jgi:hypothetical protein
VIAEYVPGYISGYISGHLGTLHAHEQVLVVLLAFGPLLLLAVTVRIARRRVEDDDE